MADNYSNDDAISLTLPNTLYTELFDSEVDGLDICAENLSPILGSHFQFAQGMVSAEKVSPSEWLVELTEDALIYLVNIALPANMEMWSGWGTIEGSLLMRQAKRFLDSRDIYYPY
jgi:hypothetical protein